MIPRRVLVAAALTVGVLASGASAETGSHSLDGKRRNHTRYTARLDLPAVSVRGDAEPVPGDCFQESACDHRTLKLTLPKGSTVGWFEVVAEVERNLNLMLVLYDATWEPVASADVTAPHSQPYQCCDPVSPSYRVVLRMHRLAAGRYTLIAYDRGGMGSFTSDVRYVAHPPIRKPPKKSKG